MTVPRQPVIDIHAYVAARGRDAIRQDPRYAPYFDHEAETLRVLSAAEMEALPPPTWTVEGVLPAGLLVEVYGPSDSYKSFLCLDWACRVATGLPWQSRRVERGTAVYIVAEGSGGFPKRLKAWRINTGQADANGAYFIPTAVNLLDPRAVGDLLDVLRQLPSPLRLVTFDTLARSMVGGDENSTEDMGRAIEGADRIRHETGATVVLVHHTGWKEEHGRGSTALPGAADVIIKVTAENRVVTITCEKMKDAEPFPALSRALIPVGDSLAVSLTDTVRLDPSSLTGNETVCLTVVSRDFLDDGATASEWKAAAAGAGVPRSSFYRIRTSLVTQGYVERTGDGTRRAPYRYRPTPRGRSIASLTSPTAVSPESQASLTSRPPLGGVRPETETGQEPPW